MIPKTGQYYYAYYRGGFAIFRCTHADEKGYAGERVLNELASRDREAIRKRVYELNGWKYNKSK